MAEGCLGKGCPGWRREPAVGMGFKAGSGILGGWYGGVRVEGGWRAKEGGRALVCHVLTRLN
eukprot:3041525-Rhodomonas_salina.1